MTQEDLDNQKKYYARNLTMQDNGKVHAEMAYEAGFKKALELVSIMLDRKDICIISGEQLIAELPLI